MYVPKVVLMGPTTEGFLISFFHVNWFYSVYNDGERFGVEHGSFVNYLFFEAYIIVSILAIGTARYPNIQCFAYQKHWWYYWLQ